MGRLILILTGICAFVNGMTDAVNATAATVASGAMTERGASRLAAVFDLAGAMLSGICFPAVAEAMREMTGGGKNAAAALLSVILFALVAWRLGLPTSESHGLLAALAGASLAAGGSLTGPWRLILPGLFLSVAGSAALGWLLTAASRRMRRRDSASRGAGVQRCCCALAALVHGIQDGQKFAGLLLASAVIPPAAAAVPAVLLSLGTLLGGRRLVRTVVAAAGAVDRRAALAAEGASAAVLLGGALLAVPLSTTHVRITALLGASSAAGSRGEKGAWRRLALAWLLTFPVCGALGYLLRRYGFTG